MGNASRRRRTIDDAHRARGVQAVLLIVCVAAIGLLVVGVGIGPASDALHPVVAVNGVTFNRPMLRGRMALDQTIADGRKALVRTLVVAGRITPEDASRLTDVIDAAVSDPLRAAIDGLVDDALITNEARAAGLSTSGDRTAVLDAAVRDIAGVRVTGIMLADPAGPVTSAGGFPPPPTPTASIETDRTARAAAAAALEEEMRGGVALGDIASAATAAGWRATVLDQWIGSSGPTAGLPDGLVAAARATPTGGRIGASVDAVTGVVSAAAVIDRTDGPVVPLDVSGVDGSTLDAWVAARAAESALRASLSNRWSRAVDQVEARELAIGPEPADGTTGKHASFAHVVIAALPDTERGGGTDAEAAARLATELRGLDAPTRIERFSALLAATSGREPAGSGETGFFTQDQVLPALAAAFEPSATPGDIIGPVSTAAGSELFLLRARFDGSVDERTSEALVEGRTASDLVAVARRLAPAGSWSRAAGIWRAVDEIRGSEAARQGYIGTPEGARSEPFIMRGEITIVEPTDRRTGVPDAAMLARLSVDGFESWLSSVRETAVVVRDLEPLPGIEVESPTPTAPGIPTSGIPTPALPSIGPGAP